jgi:hypothetical protein
MKEQVAVLGAEVINITEEDLVYTNDQLTKLEELRRKSGTTGAVKLKEFPRKKKKVHVEKEDSDELKAQWSSQNLKVGMPVTVTEEKHTFIGFVTAVDKTISYYPKFDIQTYTGLLKDVDHRNVSYRKIQDYSSVVIPEELKTKTTQHLLHMLKCSRIAENNGTYDYWEPGMTKIPHIWTFQIKAELANRPHIPTKAERKAMINNGKRNKRKK